MANIPSGNMMPGTGGAILSFAGTPSSGTSEIQTLTFSGTITGGTFALTFEGNTTAAIAWSSTNATLVANIDAALEALPNIGTGGVTTAVGTMTSGVGTITVAFAANLANKALSTMSAASSLTGSGAAVAVAKTTPGVSATFRGQGKGSVARDTTTGVLYSNTGTATSPTWTAQT